mgnify:CR=1 FL=1
MPVVGVEPTRVISTRDFESPSSASLRQRPFLVVDSFDFCGRGRFFRCDRGRLLLLLNVL